MLEVYLKKFMREDAGFIKENFSYWFLDNSIENIEKSIDEWNDSLGYCIMQGDEKVGMISLREKQDRVLSWGVAIKEECRGRGIAAKAFKLIEKEAQTKGYSKIISSCSKENVASFRLHKKVGFDLIREEINSAGHLMCRWEKNIC